ncbi:MAG: 50S ribosomal protein L3 N(5)-glutamine methyltransferase [Gammaproteobacteria bacterium]|nr:50S ribosomal protein L3 N(5)-glutamine methyltransferase [Gammaproteobacteria bacterium]
MPAERGASSARQLVRWAERELKRHDLCYGHGTDSAADEAAFLVLHGCGLEFDCPEAALDAPLDAATVARTRALVARRIETRQPAAYLTGRMWFAGHEFEVDSRVLVPRSPIAELILERFEPWLEPSRVRRILDVGTGSGCIAIACALAFPDARVDAVEVDAGALELARRNVQRHRLGRRVRLIRADLLPPGRLRYDLIVSNPPYVPTALVDESPAEYQAEPRLGLDGGVDGLDCVRRLLDAAPARLAPNGILLVEVGVAQQAMEQQYPHLPLTWIEFAHGGDGVFLISREDLVEARSMAAGQAGR